MPLLGGISSRLWKVFFGVRDKMQNDDITSIFLTAFVNLRACVMKCKPLGIMFRKEGEKARISMTPMATARYILTT